MHQNQQNEHVPVLLDAVLSYLAPMKGDSYLDLTAGYGGHAKSILERTLRPNQATLVDRDQHAVNYLRKEFKGEPVTIIHKDFLTASQELAAEGKKFDLILADIGVSSPHLNTASRGFSINRDGPLDMRMDQRQDLMAETIVNTYDEVQLTELIRSYGEEPRARTIAKAIVANRPIATTGQLAHIVATASASWRTRGSKIHPATRTFQALRIAVNSELEQLKLSLPIWINLLEVGGRLGVISFHSLEDRIVKQALLEASGNRYDAQLKLLTKHPVMGQNSEIVSNPRARSAKLRAAAKINNQIERRD
jgi:16S rRNA (cytosine1402-N4)-methyltransferase